MEFYEYLKGVTPIQVAAVAMELQQLEGKIIDDNTSARSVHLGGFHRLAIGALKRAQADEEAKKVKSPNGNIEKQIQAAATKGSALASAAKPRRKR